MSLAECPYFKTELLELTKPFARDLADCGQFLIAIALEGQTRLVRRSACPACADEVLTLNAGECALIPASDRSVCFEPAGSGSKLLTTFVPR